MILPRTNAFASAPWVFAFPDGRPAVFVPSDDDATGLVECLDATCSETVLTNLPGLTGVERPLMLDGGFAGIDYDEGSLRYVVCGNPDCSSSSAVEITGEVEFWEVDLDDRGLPVFIYSLQERPGVTIASCADPACSSGAEVTAHLAHPPVWGSFALSAANGRVLFAPWDPRVLEPPTLLFSCSELACAEPVSTVVVPEFTEMTGWRDSFAMTMGSDGLPIIAYGWFGERRELHVVHCDDPACATSSDTVVDTLRGGWQGVSLVIAGDGMPVMAYRSDDEINVLKCEDPACSSRSVAQPVLGTPGDPSLTVDDDGLPVIAFYEELPDPSAGAGDPEGLPPAVPVLFRCADFACTARS